MEEKSLSKMRKGTLVSFSALLGMVILGVWFFARHSGELKRILQIDLLSFFILSLLCIMAIAISGLKINAILSVFRTRITLWEGFGLSALNTMANFYFAKAGVATKGVYLKKKHNFPYAHFLSSVAGTYVVSLMTQGLLGLFFLLLNARRGGFSVEIFFAFLALVVGGLVLFGIPKVSLQRRSGFLEKVARVQEGWETIKNHKKIVLLLAFLNASYVATGALRLYVSYRALGYAVGLLPCMVIAPLSTITVIVSFTPGALGIRQALVGYSSKLLDLGLTEGVMASTIDHGVGTIWVFFFGIIFSNWILVGKNKAGGRKAGQKRE